MELDFSPYALKVVRRAAEIEGRSVSDFIGTAAQEVAERTIERTQLIRSLMSDQERITKAFPPGKRD